MAVNSSMPILVVEDHNATALILRTLLTRLGFSDVDEATAWPRSPKCARRSTPW
jgi:CheY-like chemotaxis protein